MLRQSVADVGDRAAAVLKTLRDRLAKGNTQFAGDVEAMIANLDRPEMRTLSQMLTRRGWRVHVIRRFLGFPRDRDHPRLNLPSACAGPAAVRECVGGGT